MTTTALAQDDSKGAYCTKCQNVVSMAQVKHELSYALVDGIGHILVCVCVGCFNKRFVETQPANQELTVAFTNWMIYALAANPKNAKKVVPKADKEFATVAALYGIEIYKGDENDA